MNNVPPLLALIMPFAKKLNIELLNLGLQCVLCILIHNKCINIVIPDKEIEKEVACNSIITLLPFGFK